MIKISFNIFEKLQELAKKQENKIEEDEINIENTKINQEELELAKKLDAIEEFSIDRFEENIAVLENRKNGDIINVETNKLPGDIKEGDILKCINGKYIFDELKTQSEKERIQNKMNDLWN